MQNNWCKPFSPKKLHRYHASLTLPLTGLILTGFHWHNIEWLEKKSNNNKRATLPLKELKWQTVNNTQIWVFKVTNNQMSVQKFPSFSISITRPNAVSCLTVWRLTDTSRNKVNVLSGNLLTITTKWTLTRIITSYLLLYETDGKVWKDIAFIYLFYFE